MHYLCIKAKPSKTVHSFLRNKCMNAYGVKLKSHWYSGVLLTPQNFLKLLKKKLNLYQTVLEIAYENLLKKFQWRILVPDPMKSLLMTCHENQQFSRDRRNSRFKPKLISFQIRR